MDAQEVFVVGTLMNRKIYSVQHGWVKPDDWRKIFSAIIYSRQDAEQMVRFLSSLENNLHLGPIGMMSVNISLGNMEHST